MLPIYCQWHYIVVLVLEIEKLCCFYHLPRILHTFNFNAGSMMWITCVTITTVVKYILF